jgi:hypothetical protein
MKMRCRPIQTEPLALFNWYSILHQTPECPISESDRVISCAVESRARLEFWLIRRLFDFVPYGHVWTLPKMQQLEDRKWVAVWCQFRDDSHMLYVFSMPPNVKVSCINLNSCQHRFPVRLPYVLLTIQAPKRDPKSCCPDNPPI